MATRISNLVPYTAVKNTVPVWTREMHFQTGGSGVQGTPIGLLLSLTREIPLLTFGDWRPNVRIQ